MSLLFPRLCLNRSCGVGLESEKRNGWRLRSGELAPLCDRCASAYAEGRFCDTFHSHESGWRCCESCGKRVHCGCIVSVHAFVMLDIGGIRCRTCETKWPYSETNPGCPFPMYNLRPFVHHKEPCDGNRTRSAGPWCGEMNITATQTTRMDHQSRMPFFTDPVNGIDRSVESNRITSPFDGSADPVVCNVPECLKTVFKHDEKPISCVPYPVNPSFFGHMPSTSIFSCSTTACGPVDSSVISCSQSEKSPQVNLSGETQTNVAFFQANACFQKQVLPGYCPEMSNERRVSANPRPSFTPLFEKMLSASDASRVGRLVLPKKCAENYFPQVSHPEGSPLQVRDEKGNEWTFRFRSWTNNNSRMHVLEGITPCFQFWKLRAGDVVKFSRLEPEGKLIIGFRKASNTLRSEQAASAEHTSGLVKVDNGRCIAAKEGFVHSKRKNNMLGSTNKKIKLENVDMISVMVTMEEAQALLRPVSGNVPHVVIVEEFEIEEYEDCPIIGRPMLFARNYIGGCVQWPQHLDSIGWPELPSNVVQPPSLACSGSFSCNGVQESTRGQRRMEHPKCSDLGCSSVVPKLELVESSSNDPSRRRSIWSLLSQIDLNMHPERCEHGDPT
ncbi:hypothetical protein Droror1_Dr00020832 [Drosera rotundifolia]